MATDYGTDLALVDDLPLTDDLVGGLPNLGNAMIRRLTTPRGSLVDDPDYGLDVREWLNAGATQGQLDQLMLDVAAECSKDQRVLDAAATYQLLGTGPADRQLELTLELATADGPFQLVLLVDQLTVQQLRGA